MLIKPIGIILFNTRLNMNPMWSDTNMACHCIKKAFVDMDGTSKAGTYNFVYSEPSFRTALLIKYRCIVLYLLPAHHCIRLRELGNHMDYRFYVLRDFFIVHRNHPSIRNMETERNRNRRAWFAFQQYLEKRYWIPNNKSKKWGGGKRPNNNVTGKKI
jgi:hypothetical protein